MRKTIEVWLFAFASCLLILAVSQSEMRILEEVGSTCILGLAVEDLSVNDNV